MKLFYDDAYAIKGSAYDTTRKSRWIAESLAARPIPGVTLHAPAPVTVERLADLHDPAYVETVRTGEPRALAESQGFAWDPGLWLAARTSTGGMVEAALAALRDGAAGTLSSGLHHARRAEGMGYCTFNGLALAALAAHRATGGRILTLDLDAHCGGGTFDLLRGFAWSRIVDVSTDPYDVFTPEGNERERASLDLVTDAGRYLETVVRRLDACRGDFALCVYNAGMDPHEDCEDGGLFGLDEAVLRTREDLVFDWCRDRGIPVAFTVAGGYVGDRLDRQRLVDLHRLTFEAATHP